MRGTIRKRQRLQLGKRRNWGMSAKQRERSLLAWCAATIIPVLLYTVYMHNALDRMVNGDKTAASTMPRVESRYNPFEISPNHRRSVSIESAVEDLQKVSTKFYIYDDYAISKSLYTHLFRLQGELVLSDFAGFDHVMKDIQAERATLEALEKHPSRTLDPNEASLYIVPTPISELFAYGCRWEDCTQYDDAFQALKRHEIFKKAQGHNHVLISYGWYSFNKRYNAFVPALARNNRVLENVTVASHYDPFGCFDLASKTSKSTEKGFNHLFPQETPVTKAFSVGLGVDAPFPFQKPSLEKFQKSDYLVFYHSRNVTQQAFGFGSTPFRQLLLDLDKETMASLPRSSIGFNLGVEKWKRQIMSSKFCLVMRGDTPHSHSLMYSIRAGCIPVIVSDYYQEYAGPFKSTLTMNDFCIFVKEKNFLKDPVKEILKLHHLPVNTVSAKLRNLTIAQSIVLPDHPKSLFVEAFLREAMVANQRLVPDAETRELTKVGQDSVIVSGNKLTYRYPINFTYQKRLIKELGEPVVIAGVLSGAKEKDGRFTIRSTWGEQHRGRVLFLLSGPWEDVQEEFLDHGDLLWVGIPEDYYLLTYKTQVFFHFTETHVDHYDYMLKADDDSYIGIQEISRLLKKYRPRYMGRCGSGKKRRPVVREANYYWPTSKALYPHDIYPYYAQGMGYVVSRDFAKCAITKLADIKFFPWEDVATGLLAEECGVICQDDEFYWEEDPTRLITVEHRLTGPGEMLWQYWGEWKKMGIGQWVDKPWDLKDEPKNVEYEIVEYESA